MRGRVMTTLMGVAAISSVFYAVLWKWVDFAFPAEANAMLFFRLLGAREAIAFTESAGAAIVAVGVLGALVYSVLRFWLWLRARSGPGSVLLLVAALIGALPLVAQAWVWATLTFGLASAVVPWLVRVESLAAAYGWFAQPLALLLLSAGLLRARAVAPWVAWVGVASAFVLALSSPQYAVSFAWLDRLDLAGNSDAYLGGLVLRLCSSARLASR